MLSLKSRSEMRECASMTPFVVDSDAQTRSFRMYLVDAEKFHQRYWGRRLGEQEPVVMSGFCNAVRCSFSRRTAMHEVNVKPDAIG